jgi:lipopolysaccharide transport system permease protein
VIESKSNLLHLRLGEVWQYRDLLMLMVRRDIIATYKQTILGPIWFVIQPVLTTLTFMVVFGRIAGISTDGMPPMVFYLSGIILWNYFAECLNRSATVFRDNASIFGKVYFPRLIMPLANVASSLVKMSIQLLLFLSVWAYFYFYKETNIQPSLIIFLIPVLIVIMGGLGLGFGLIISALTTKYRDLIFLLAFGVQLLMYATPVIYTLSDPNIQQSKYKWLLQVNPMAPVIETFRFAFLGRGAFSWELLAYSFGFTVAIIVLGTIIFNKVEKSFMDTV